jgi:galactose mutarotase-like enzyme
MLAEIESQYLKAAVASLGAELKSLKNKQNGFEYIWQGDATYWERSAPILFPIVGEVNRDTIYVNEAPYTLKRHGFARNSNFIITKQEKNSVAFTLNSSEETGKIFPSIFLSP